MITWLGRVITEAAGFPGLRYLTMYIVQTDSVLSAGYPLPTSHDSYLAELAATERRTNVVSHVSPMVELQRRHHLPYRVGMCPASLENLKRAWDTPTVWVGGSQ